MKLLVIGLGQCGGRIADRLARLNKRARALRGIDIIADAFAVNTDVADLSGLRTVKADYKHRILIGGQRTNGHGVGKISELGAEIAREETDKIVDSLRATDRFYDTDAFLVIAAAAGGTGSGSIAVLTQYLKERYVGKPVYDVIVLPFRQEETTETRTVYNTAMCLKSSYLVADAIFLIDNQRYVKKNSSAESNMAIINARAVEPFFNLLCAGEETSKRYVGAKTLDAGDIIQTLAGWTVIGYGEVRIPRIRLPGEDKLHFREKITETQKGNQAMDKAIGELSLKCNPTDARRALYLLTAPPGAMTMELINELSASLKNVATEAIIRSGDYPREKGLLGVTVVLSALVNSRKVMEYFTKTINYISITKRRREGIEYEHRGIEEAFKDIPSLL